MEPVEDEVTVEEEKPDWKNLRGVEAVKQEAAEEKSEDEEGIGKE